MADGKLPVARLTTHTFPIAKAADAYDLVTSGAEPFMGIVIEYPEVTKPKRRLELKRPRTELRGNVGYSMVGAGNFTRLVLTPLLRSQRDAAPRGLCTAKGMNATFTGEKGGYAFATTDIDEVLGDVDTKAVFVTTRHDQHAEMVIKALRAGKHVFVEKPLCINFEELQQIDAVMKELGDNAPILMVGFNRRFAPGTAKVRKHFAGAVPLSLSYRFASGEIPANAWPQDIDVGGGRIIGESCHVIDICTALADSVPVRVFAESVGKSGSIETTDDRVVITVRHANGSISSINYQAGGDKGGPVERLEVFGGGRTAIVDGWQTIELWANGKRQTSSGGKDKGYRGEIDAFFDACRNGGPSPILWEHIYHVTWASIAAVHSLREGGPIDFE